MLQGLRPLALALACASIWLAAAQPASAAGPSQDAPVPSLTPQATQALWSRLAHRPVFRPYSIQVGCRPLRAVFYAATDWLRLTTTLAASASPCAQYSISVPPVVADKTKPRPDQAWRIRALGPSFHALAEIHYGAWQKWVASTGSSWYQAGVEARRRMAAAGYDVASGDTWALNEVSSAVRRGDGNARGNLAELLRGLYDAAGEGPPTRGVVFVVGVGQRVPALATYKARTQEWLQDSAFWSAMNAYVSDWSQEVYGDVRSYAVPGTPLDSRREALVEYLRHQDLLAAAGGSASGTANAFFANAASALANAAWQWGSAFGWTLVDPTLMQQYVSAQVYALRNHGARAGRATDRFGFAWAPKNSDALAASDFAQQTGALLARIAAAIHDSADETPSDPGIGACTAPPQGTWCAGDLSGATATAGWRTFRAWSPTTLAFVSPPQTIAAGVVSGPISLQVQVAGVAARPAAAVTATVASSSPTGTFATSATGPFTPTVSFGLPAGTFSTVQLFYQDPTAGSPTLTASGAGVVTGTQPLTVGGAAPLSLRVEPTASTLFPGGTATFKAVGVDAFGNATPTPALWTMTPDTLGTLSTASGPTTTFTAGPAPGVAQVTATITTPTGTLSATAAVTVTPPPVVRVAAVRYGVAKKLLHVYVTVVDAQGRRVRDAAVTVALYREGKVYARAAGTTSAGSMTFTRPASIGTYRTKVTRVVAANRMWDGVTPSNAFTKKPAPEAPSPGPVGVTRGRSRGTGRQAPAPRRDPCRGRRCRSA